MQSAIKYDPKVQDNFYYIIAQANEMRADSTEVRRHMEMQDFAFYIVATKDEVTNVTTLESWYLDTFNRTFTFVTTEKHLAFTEVRK